jgi:UDP-glucose 4-epimerase
VTILITGANGFIGRNLHDFIQQKEKNSICPPKWVNVGRTVNEHIHYQCDLTNFEQVKEMMKAVDPTTIIHLSGYSTSRPSSDDPSKIVRENIIATQNLLEAVDSESKPQFIFASSILTYGENSRSEHEICEPTSVYGMTKLAAEHLIKAYNHKLSHSIFFRLCATIGEKYMTHGMMYDFLKRNHTQANVGFPFDVIGQRPGAIKPFIHVDDVCSAIWTQLYKCHKGIYNLCPNDNISVEDVALRVLHRVGDSGRTIKWNVNQVWRGDIQRIVFNNDKFTKDFFPIQSSIDAVNKVIDNYEWSAQ